MLHVVHIIDLLSIGGAQKLLVTFAETARDHDIRLTVISLSSDSTTPVANELKTSGAQVLAFPGKGLFDLGRLWRLFRFLRTEPCAVIQTHLSYANIVGTLVAHLAGTPCIATLHNTKFDNYSRFDKLRNRLEILILRLWSKRIVAVGHVVEKAHQDRFKPRHIDVIPNAVSIVPMVPADERMKVQAELADRSLGPFLISLGRLTKQKGYEDLLTAFSLVRQAHPKATLLIAGDGELHERLAAKISSLELDGHAVLLGARNDVPRLLAASDLFVIASLWEGLPVAVLEAMAAGLPVVATGVGDVPQVVAPGTGLLTPPGSPERLAEAINTFLDDPGRMRIAGERARARIMAHYGVGEWFDRLLQLYRQACLSARSLARKHGKAT